MVALLLRADAVSPLYGGATCRHLLSTGTLWVVTAPTFILLSLYGAGLREQV